ncbi:hypothetical protein QQ045_009877 [Rhodiola kirilowii]
MSSDDEKVKSETMLENNEDDVKIVCHSDDDDDDDDDISPRAHRIQKMREAKEERENKRFRRQLTDDEIRDDLELMTGGTVRINKRPQKVMTRGQKLKLEMRVPGSQLEELYKQQVLKEKPHKKRVAQWGLK